MLNYFFYPVFRIWGCLYINCHLSFVTDASVTHKMLLPE